MANLFHHCLDMQLACGSSLMSSMTVVPSLDEALADTSGIYPTSAEHALSGLLEHTTVYSDFSSVTSALFTKKIVLTSSCPYSEGPPQSESSDRFQIALSLHQECPYSKCPCKVK